MQYTSSDKLNKLYSFMPHMKCKTQEFADSFGTHFNHLAGFGVTSMVTSLSIVSNTATTSRAEIVATFREPVIAEPLNYSSGTNYGNCMWSVPNLELNLPVWFPLQDDLLG